MGYDRRVTLRCLCEDLTGDWTDSSQQRSFAELRTALQARNKDSDIVPFLEAVPTTAQAAHPLVSSFHAAFAADDPGLHRESISGLTEPHWWKQKSARWRGAATDADAVGDNEVWLCAGGIRADGEPRDFYAAFMKAIKNHGPNGYLPKDEDIRLQVVERKIARRDAWLEQIRLSAMVCLHECVQNGEAQTVHIPGPYPDPVSDPLMHLTVDLEREGSAGEELIELLLTVSKQDLRKPKTVESALNAVRSVVEPVTDEWKLLPGVGSDQIWAVLLSSETLENAAHCYEAGRLLPALSGSHLKLGVQAHYTRKARIVDATVEGDAVRGLCGTWFVPTARPDDLPVCPTCDSEYDEMSEPGARLPRT